MQNTELKHTPGPWIFRPSYHEGEPQGFVVQAGRKVIADLTCSPEDLSVEETNARLIACAPELLSLLVDFVAPYSGNDNPPTIVILARSAIAKATGGAEL